MIVLYWFTVGFVFLFVVSVIVGLAFGYGIREALAGAFWQALVISVVCTALAAALVFGLSLSGVPL